MRSRTVFIAVTTAVVALITTACGTAADVDAAAGNDDTTALEQDSILAFLNGPDASVDTLVSDVRIQARAARNIVAHVRGADARLDTSDDRPLRSIAELDAIRYVGPATIEAIKAYVRSHYQNVDLVIEDVALSNDNAAQMVLLANSAAVATLDDDVGLDSRAARAIVAARPILDIKALAAVSYVGKTALTHMRDWVISHPATTTTTAPPAEVPVPFVLEWINDYRGTGYVSALDLHRDGTYDAVVGGAAEKGVFFGPRTGTFVAPLPLRLVTVDGAEWSATLTLWSGTSAEVAARDGHAPSHLVTTLPTDGEDACDSGGGSYLDDDANSDQLFCECPDGMSWIPSQGGCVH
jgi:hypothetical protein